MGVVDLEWALLYPRGLLFLCIFLLLPFADELSAAPPPSQLQPRALSVEVGAKCQVWWMLHFTGFTTFDLSCKKVRSGWNPNDIKDPSRAGSTRSHYRTIGFFFPFWFDIVAKILVHRFGQFIRSSPLMNNKEESDGDHHVIHIHVVSLTYWGSGHLNFNNVPDILNWRILDETIP